MLTRDVRRTRAAGARRILAGLALAGLAVVCGSPTAARAAPTPAPSALPRLSAAALPGLSGAALLQGVAALRVEVGRSPVLSDATRARAVRRLDGLAGRLPQVVALEREIARQTALLHTLDDVRAVARAGVDHLQGVVHDDLHALTDALGFTTAAVSTTAQSIGVTATVALTTAHLDLQVHTARLVLDVQAGVRLLSLLALDARARLDTRRLAGSLNALARQVHAGLILSLRDLSALARSDPAAATDAQSGLVSGLTTALVGLSDTLTGALDARQSSLRLGIARLQGRLTRALNGAAVALRAVQRDVLAAEVAAAPLSAAQRQQVAAGLAPGSDPLRDAASASAQLAGRLSDLGVLQDAQARIDREVQKAQADLDGIMARSDAALQGRLRSDVTVAISDTEQTVHVHLAGIDVGALVRDLDFNVKLGLSVLQIAALHAEVTPSTHNFQGSARTHISGVDLLLQARLHGLQARIRTDVDAVRAAQAQASSAVRARVASLRSSLSNVLAPLIKQYRTAGTQLQARIDRDLAAVAAALGAARGHLAALAHLAPLQGRVGASMVAMRRAPATGSADDGWLEPGTVVPLVGYVRGEAVRDPHTGRLDARWYVMRNLWDGSGYLYLPAALLTVAPAS